MAQSDKTTPGNLKKSAATSSGAGADSSGRVCIATTTPPGTGGIAEIHVWGQGSAVLVDSLFRARSGRKISQTPRERFLYGHIVRGVKVLDEVIVRRKESDSIYGTETVEIGCHGGGAAAQAIISALRELGASMSGFDAALEAACTEGRISRIEVEARHALRSCVSESALPALLAELDKHHLEREIENTRRLIEGSAVSEGVLKRVRSLLENSWAIPYVEVQPVFIAGYPNVGKSSMFNALVGRERVIVHETPGTTRDVVEEVILLDGVPARLHDSAGVGESKNGIERLAEKFALRAIGEAVMILFVFDGSRFPKEAEMKLYRQLDCSELIPIINKADLPPARQPEELDGAARISALTGHGIPELERAIARGLAAEPGKAGEPTLFTGRQRDLLNKMLSALEAGERGSWLEAVNRLLGRGK